MIESAVCHNQLAMAALCSRKGRCGEGQCGSRRRVLTPESGIGSVLMFFAAERKPRRSKPRLDRNTVTIPRGCVGKAGLHTL